MAFPLDVRVYLALGQSLRTTALADLVWTDVTAYVYTRSPVTISVGLKDGNVEAPPLDGAFVTNNRDGRWSDDNPEGVWYGQLLAMVTPVKVTVNPGTGEEVRAVGIIDRLPPRWDVSGEDRFVEVGFVGRRSILEQGRHSAQSYLAAATAGLDSLVAAWLLEDSAGSTTAASSVSGVEPMTTDGTVDFAGGTPPAGSSAAPGLTAGGLLGTLPDGTVVTRSGGVVTVSSQRRWTVQFAAQLAAAGATAIIAEWTTTGGATQWDIQVTGSAVNLRYWSGGTATTASTLAIDVLDDLWHGYVVNLNFGGGGFVTCTLTVDASTDTDTTTVVAGRIKTIRLNPDRSATVMAMTALSVCADNDVDSVVLLPEVAGAGQDARERFAAVGAAFGIEVDVAGTVGTAQAVGPWRPLTALELFKEAAEADAGFVVERITGELGFDPHEEYENQAVALALTTSHVKPDLLEPTNDPQYVRNTWTVTRVGGGSATFSESAGRRGTTLVGELPDSVELNVASDDQLYVHAGYRVRQGVAEGLRFATIPLDLYMSQSLIAQWLACRVGSRVQATGPFAGISPDVIDVVLRGYTESFAPYTWDVALSCAPYAPYLVGTLGEDSAASDDEWVGHLDADSMSNIIAADTTDTSWTIATDPPCITTAANSDSFPVKLRVAGEDITLEAATAVAAAFGAVGAVDHDDNASLTPGLPASVAEGDLLLLFAAIRNSGTGTVNTPSGWARLGAAEGMEPFRADENVAVLYKYAGPSESGPTVTFTGGAAGATTSAQIARFAGVSGVVKAALGQLNSSAANIAYPDLAVPADACMILYFGWKQDDWTSVASPGTEIAEPSSTTGSDQGLVWAYALQTTRANITSASFTVTGGASAISRGAVVALMTGVRTATVERSVNGVVKSHAVGTAIELHLDDALQIGM